MKLHCIQPNFSGYTSIHHKIISQTVLLGQILPVATSISMTLIYLTHRDSVCEFMYFYVDRGVKGTHLWPGNEFFVIQKSIGFIG